MKPNLNYSSSYTYDEAGQLVEAVDGETGTVYRYTYDASGNIRSMYSSRVDSEGNETGSIPKEFYYTNGVLTGYGFGGMAHTEIETDAMGNPVKITSGTNLSSNLEPVVKTLTWGEGRMLLGISRDEDNHIAYTLMPMVCAASKW